MKYVLLCVCHLYGLTCNTSIKESGFFPKFQNGCSWQISCLIHQHRQKLLSIYRMFISHAFQSNWTAFNHQDSEWGATNRCSLMQRQTINNSLNTTITSVISSSGLWKSLESLPLTLSDISRQLIYIYIYINPESFFFQKATLRGWMYYRSVFMFISDSQIYCLLVQSSEQLLEVHRLISLTQKCTKHQGNLSLNVESRSRRSAQQS